MNRTLTSFILALYTPGDRGGGHPSRVVKTASPVIRNLFNSNGNSFASETARIAGWDLPLWLVALWNGKNSNILQQPVTSDYVLRKSWLAVVEPDLTNIITSSNL